MNYWMNVWSFGGFLGFAVIAWLCSRNRRVVVWRPVLWGLGLQLLLGAIIFNWPFSQRLMLLLSNLVNRALSASREGVVFVFGQLGAADAPQGVILATQILPLIVVFASLMAVLYYWRIIPFIIRHLAGGIYRIFRTSGAESIVAASNIFVGIESVTAVRPYLGSMTRSELFMVLTVGMATVASSTLAVYVSFLNQVFPTIAGHLISASVMSIPASFAIAKLMEPEDEIPATSDWEQCRIHTENPAGSFVEAILNGANDGSKLAVGVGIMLLAMIGLLGMLKAAWNGFIPAEYNFDTLLSYGFYPFAAMLGITPGDIPAVAKMLSTRLLLTEIPSYLQLAEFAKTGSPRTTLVCSYALCGFTHIASMAIFIGGIAALVPNQKPTLSKLGFKALLGATLATLMTGAVAGIFAFGQSQSILGF